MRYQPHTEDDIREMLATLGMTSLAELFTTIPEHLRLKRDLDLPPGLDEASLVNHMQELAKRNTCSSMHASFLGAGLYEHFIPSVVDHVLLRGEFLTSYTPYQAELSQGTLKAIFEFQSMMAEVLDFDLANASMYDGAHATAEALLMGLRLKRKASRVLVSQGVHPDYRAVSETYLQYRDNAYHELPLRDGVTHVDDLTPEVLEGVAMVMIQSPNFYGCVEDVAAIAQRCHDHGVLCAVTFNEPLAFGLLTPPGEAGADVAVGEAQSFGIPPGGGGPLLGVFACRKSFVRSTPGRLVAQTTDTEGREGYVLTLSTREQHIRRERATSNICTNQGLMALAATIYLSLLGKQGLIDLARVNMARATYAKQALTALDGVSLRYNQPTFNEFTLNLPVPAAKIIDAAADQGLAAGLDLGRFDNGRAHELLVAVTEHNTRDHIDALVDIVRHTLA